MVGEGGIEPPIPHPQRGVLPLYYSPMSSCHYIHFCDTVQIVEAAFMDFGHIISEAFQITRRHRVLWIFGTILAIFGGFPQVYNFSFNSFNFPGGFTDSKGMEKSSEELATNLGFLKYIEPSTWLILLGLSVIVFLTLVFVLIYFQTWSYAALASQTLNIIKGQAASFKEGKAIGEKFFWRILGFRILFGIALIPVILVFAVFPLLFFIVGLKGLAIAFLIIEGLLFFFGVIVYSILIAIVSEFGVRKMIEADLKIIESIKQGWYLFRDNLGTTLLVWLVSVGLGFVIIFPVLFTSLIFIALGFAFFIINPWLVIIPIVSFFIIFAFIGGLWNVFIFSYWSLAYTNLLNKPSFAKATEGEGR